MSLTNNNKFSTWINARPAERNNYETPAEANENGRKISANEPKKHPRETVELFTNHAAIKHDFDLITFFHFVPKNSSICKTFSNPRECRVNELADLNKSVWMNHSESVTRDFRLGSWRILMSEEKFSNLEFILFYSFSSKVKFFDKKIIDLAWSRFQLQKLSIWGLKRRRRFPASKKHLS